MAHQHAQAHLVRRQRGNNNDDSDPRRPNQEEVVEVVTVVEGPDGFETEEPTDAPRTLLPPAVRTRPISSEDNEDEPQPTTTARQPAATSPRPSPAHQPDAQETQTRSAQNASTLMVATKSPTPNAAASAATGIASATAAISSAAAAPATEDGMSTGAKAGLALGILLVVCALLTGVLLMYRRKKNQIAAASKENEKIDMYNAPAPLPPQVQAAAPPAPSIRTNRTMSTAPRLSLRPVTQFDPAFNEQRKSGGNLLTVAAAGGAAAYSQSRDASQDRPSSAWERPGAANAPATNPFNDPATPATTANPFGNNAAVDAHQAVIPDSPPNASPMHSSQPSRDLANPASVIADREPAPVENALPLPPVLAANSPNVPPSPAWTEDIPASPGPAPSGPPPVAGAMAGGPQNSAPGANNVHRVQLDFKPSMQDELDLHAGQLVRMLHEYDDGWALCIRMDRSQQGVVPRTCLSKHPVKPRNGPPRQGPPPPGMRGPPIRPPMGPNGVPQPRPLSPASGRSSPHPPNLSPANGRMSPGPRSMSPGPRQMGPPQMQGAPRARSNSNAPQYGGPQMAPPPQMGRPRSNSASQAGNPRRGPAPGPSPMNPNAGGPMPPRKPVPGMAM